MVAESFVPHVSGVTTSVLRSAEQLRALGHEVIFLAPAPGRTAQPPEPSSVPSAAQDSAAQGLASSSAPDDDVGSPGVSGVSEVSGPGALGSSTAAASAAVTREALPPSRAPLPLLPGQTAELVNGFPTLRVPSMPLAGYPGIRFSAGSVSAIRRIIRILAPEVVHAASPLMLGARAVTACRMLGVPSVAVYQTDIAAYALRYGLPWLSRTADQKIAKIHREATMTLAPSKASAAYLESLEVPRVFRWGRGVDATLFAPSRSTLAARERMGAGPGELLVGFVGRLAPEKQVEDLRGLQQIPGVRLAVIGDGPSRSHLEQTLHRAQFTGALHGLELAEHLASLDVFVHPGESETFGQTLQEAQASGVATVAVASGGALELVEDGVTGRRYSPGQLGQLRSIIEELAEDAAGRRDLAASGYRAVQGRSWQAVSEQLEQHYHRAVQFHRADQLHRWRTSRRPAVPFLLRLSR